MPAGGVAVAQFHISRIQVHIVSSLDHDMNIHGDGIHDGHIHNVKNEQNVDSLNITDPSSRMWQAHAGTAHFSWQSSSSSPK